MRAFVVLLALMMAAPTVFAVGEVGPNGETCDPTNFETQAPFNDRCYHQGLFFVHDTAELDVLIYPPVSPYQLRDWQLVEQSVDMWASGIKALGADWLAQGLKINAYTVGHEYVPPEALADPEVIVLLTTQVNPALLFGVAVQNPNGPCVGLAGAQSWEELPGFHQHEGSPVGSFVSSCATAGTSLQCYVVNTNFMNTPTPDNRQSMFDLISHEVGHCLTLGHVGDATTESSDDSLAYPEHDILSYESDGLRSPTMHCVSTLNVRALELSFGALLGQPGYTTPSAASTYAHMHPDDWKAHDCKQSTAALDDVDYLLAANPLSPGEQDPDPENTPPTAELQASPATGIIPLEVTFSLDGSDQETATQDLTWSLDVDGDGTPEFTHIDGSLPLQVTYTFTEAGTFSPVLRVSDGEDQVEDAAEVEATVPPLAVDAGGPYSGQIDAPISIGASHVDGPTGVATCTWTGSGATFASATSCSTTVTYSSPGSKSITVTITKGDAEAMDVATVQVAAPQAPGDQDGDGIPDAQDNCPTAANADQADLDDDGVGDACDDDWDGDGGSNSVDNCPRVANADQADLDDDGVGDACDDDWDGDGILNGVDNCPRVANADQADLDDDGAGDACDNDRDGDGVPNGLDNCPRVVNADQADLDDDGVGDACDDDWDGDGILNGVDNCPRIANADQADHDGDGAGDACSPDIEEDPAQECPAQDCDEVEETEVKQQAPLGMVAILGLLVALARRR